MADIFTPTDWVDGTTVIDMARLKNGETQYLKVAGIQTLDALPVSPSNGQNVCRVGNVLYTWTGTAWRELTDAEWGNIRGTLSSQTDLQSALDIKANVTALEAEASARATADNILQANIDAEAQTRQIDDTALQANITAEANTRSAGDATLQLHIDTEIADRTNADTALGTRIDGEIANRTSADTALGGRIDAEITNRTDADTALGVRIDTEISDRTSADTALGTRITNEIADRTDADTVLGTRIDNEASARASADTTLQNNINAEASSRAAADTVLQSNIDLKADKFQGTSAAGQNVVIDANGYIGIEAKPTLGTAASKDVGTSQGQIPILGTNGKLADSVIPPLAIGNYVGSVSAKADLTTLATAQQGDIAKVTADTDVNNDGVWWLNGVYSTLDNWIQIVGPGAVISVNGQSGIVTLTAANVQALPTSTLYGKTLSVSGRTVTLKDQNGGTLATITTQDTTYSTATTSANGLMSATDKTKLDGIETGAQVNTVTSVAGRVGAVVLTKSDVGLANVDNTSDSAKPISTAMQTALDLKATVVALTAEANTRASADTALTNHVQTVDDDLVTHMADTANPHAVTKAQVGLGNCDNTSDASKPISTATQTALDGKVDKVTGKGLSTEDFTTAEKTKLSGIEAGAQVNDITSVAGRTGAVVLTKGDVGLGNVDNTADANKPISTAVQTALDGKQATGDYATNTALTSEASTRASADTALQTNIDAKLDKQQGTANAGKFMKVGTDGALTPDSVPGGIELSNIAPVALGSSAAVGTGGYAARNDHVHPYPTKANIGLGNVDNTSDASKPISTAVQTALDLKATTAALSSEASTRSTADTTLQTNIDAKQDRELFFESLAASSWVADTTYSDYAYRCDIACTGVLAAYWADVVMGVTEATSGDYAPVAICGAGYVRIYSKKSTSVTVPSIKVTVRT